MDRNEIIKEMHMTYNDLLAYLIQKYGGALYDYFVNEECRTNNKKVSRTKEGLYCHHMDEDKGTLLSHPEYAKSQPFDWQKKERLVYCNILEHLILHIKISVLRENLLLTPGVFYICRDINDMFIKKGTSVAWKKDVLKRYRIIIMIIYW